MLGLCIALADVEGSATFVLSRLRGRLSRLPPKIEEGASARTEAFVSSEFRRLRLDEEASVRMEALSVSRLFAVAELYVVGCPCGARWAGTADAGELIGN